jgi:hypothetical protein
LFEWKFQHKPHKKIANHPKAFIDPNSPTMKLDLVAVRRRLINAATANLRVETIDTVNLNWRGLPSSQRPAFLTPASSATGVRRRSLPRLATGFDLIMDSTNQFDIHGQQRGLCRTTPPLPLSDFTTAVSDMETVHYAGRN